MDFLKYSAEPFDAVIMNPPFSNGADIDHIRHAYELTKAGGIVVCIMSEGSFYRTDKKATAFRDWLNYTNHTTEKLDSDTFKSSGTHVSTRLVIIQKEY